MWRTAYIALGSNVGDRLSMIETACRMLGSQSDIKLLKTSSLYETEPMYVEDQGPFLNGACKLTTTLDPIGLLDRLQSIEMDMKRVKQIDKGPRNIDLDILLYEDEVFESSRLSIPHRLMLEREFVLRPLCDLGPDIKLPTDKEGRTLAEHLSALPPAARPMSSVTPLGSGHFLHALDPKRRTKIMSILNVTPDSFSDGGRNDALDTTGLQRTLAEHVKAGAEIIDIGGQSSRPHAPDVSAEDEIARVLPAIQLLKDRTDVSISIDTYRAPVALAAIKAGAHIVNDISAGQLDSDMLRTCAELGCTVILMHMRGTPATMTSKQNTTYTNGLIATVAEELRLRISEAEAAGVRRWRIILDPGIGFAKTGSQNLELLRDFAKLRDAEGLKGLPWVVGSSRKGFIGKLTGVEDPAARGFGTAATVAAAIAGGADCVRVHDVEEMRQMAAVSDAIWRV